MSDKDNGGPAYHYTGELTLRDYFAAKAMQGAMANPEVKETAGARSEWAYEIADAMLKEREK